MNAARHSTADDLGNESQKRFTRTFSMTINVPKELAGSVQQFPLKKHRKLILWNVFGFSTFAGCKKMKQPVP